MRPSIRPTSGRIARLETVVEDRDREHREAGERVEARIGEVERRFAERLDELAAERNRERAGEREALRDSLTLQKGGAILFAIGATLSTLGGALGC